MPANHTYPPRNLGEGDPWGRALETVVNRHTEDIQQIDQQLRNLARANSGQGKSLEAQIDLIRSNQRILADAVSRLAGYDIILAGQSGTYDMEDINPADPDDPNPEDPYEDPDPEA